jgi:hypothetical protein
MNGMEFTWRMFGTLAWPAVVVVGLVVYRKWITEKLTSLKFKLGLAEVELGVKVDKTGQDIASLLIGMPGQSSEDNMPMSLVDLMADVNKNRRNGIRKAFDQVRLVLNEYYPRLRRVGHDQLPEAMQDLVDRRLMDADVAESVTQLYELLKMPEWNSDNVGDTRGYAFLMLAEGVIHGIMRSAESHSEYRQARRSTMDDDL